MATTTPEEGITAAYSKAQPSQVIGKGIARKTQKRVTTERGKYSVIGRWRSDVSAKTLANASVVEKNGETWTAARRALFKKHHYHLQHALHQILYP